MKKKYLIVISAILIVSIPIGVFGRYHIYDFSYNLFNQLRSALSSNSRLVDNNYIKASVSLMPLLEESPCINKKIVTYRTVRLSPSKSFFEQVDMSRNGKEKTTYVVNSCFDLEGGRVHIPQNCILVFQNGHLKNGVLKGSNTSIVANDEHIFFNINVEGTWSVSDIYSTWFDDICNNNALKKLFSLTSDQTNNTVFVGENVYRLSAESEGDEILLIKSNTNVRLDGTIILEPNNYKRYQVFRINKKSNVTISGKGLLKGDRYSHLSSEGAMGHGIAISNGNNVTIEGITIADFWGDGIHVGGEIGEPSVYTTISNCNIKYARRNGISVVNARNFIIRGNIFEGNDGISPERAIDVEPNGGCFCENGEIINNTIAGKYGIMTSLESSGLYVKNLLIKDNLITCHTDNYSSIYGRAITFFGNPEKVTVENNIIKEGGIHAVNSSRAKKMVLRENVINGKIGIEGVYCVNNTFTGVGIWCSNCRFERNKIIADASECIDDGATALTAIDSEIIDNEIKLTGEKYRFDCPITLRKDSKIENNTLIVAPETQVRYMVRVLSGTKSTIKGNSVTKDLKILDFGLGTIKKDNITK